MSQEGIDLPGIGPKRLARLERTLGGREGLIEALDRGDVAALSQVQGISRERAIDLVKAYRGDTLDWLRTDDAERLARASIDPFLERAVTSLGRAQLSTRAPTDDPERFEARLAHARTWLDRLAEAEMDPIVAALRHVDHPTEPRPQPERDISVLVEDPELAERIASEGLDRWVDVASDPEMVAGDGLVLAATMGQTPPGSVHVTPGEPFEVVPWAAKTWAEANRELLRALAQLAPLLDTDDHASPILEALERAGSDEEIDLETVARECVTAANETIEEQIEDVTISGKDVLEVLQGGSSRAVETVVAESRAEARERFQATTGVSGSPFTDEYPLQVDPNALRQLERERRQDLALERYRSAVSIARQVEAHRDGVTRMVEDAIELDTWQAVARTAQAYGLALPASGEQLEVSGALHLELEGEGDLVDYPVPSGVALLTGANSGGKTTLLETLGQVALLAHLGLPVPARSATVPVLDGLAYYERPRQLGAGAFEGFLRTIERVLLSGDEVLVLADELEAMTELEAAAAILAEVVERLDQRTAPAVLVTHLAPFILEHVDVRTDGIEAKGLDERNELVVDRTPKVGLVARSTPELILQRLRNEAEGERARLYSSMLERLETGRRR